VTGQLRRAGPILIGQLDDFLDRVVARVGTMHRGLASGKAQAHFHVYGRDGVMGALEPSATAGNFALPLTPTENPIGPVCAFAIYHVMDSAGIDLFPIRHRQVGKDIARVSR